MLPLLLLLLCVVCVCCVDMHLFISFKTFVAHPCEAGDSSAPTHRVNRIPENRKKENSIKKPWNDFRMCLFIPFEIIFFIDENVMQCYVIQFRTEHTHLIVQQPPSLCLIHKQDQRISDHLSRQLHQVTEYKEKKTRRIMSNYKKINDTFR